jgi:nitroreductase
MHTFKTILKRRSIRRFKKRPIPYKKLIQLVNAARLAPSAANLQPWEFVIINDRKILDKIFPYTRWAGYLADKGPPQKHNRPIAYIAILINKKRCRFPEYAQADLGAAIENILLAATDMGLGSCWLGAIDRTNITKILSVPRKIKLEYLVALGYPDEESITEPIKNSHKYYKDKNSKMHVPKRRLSQLIHHNSYRH